MPGEAEPESVAQAADQFEHAFPFGEDEHLDVEVVAALLEELLQFAPISGRPAGRDPGCNRCRRPSASWRGGAGACPVPAG